jgi:hypothetical protein
MKICILGNSLIFSKIIRDLHPTDQIDIVPWRSNLKSDEFYDLVFISGFDKSIYNKSFKEALYKGYYRQFLYVKKLKERNNKINIFYMATKSKSTLIVSRYDFLKHRLAKKLVSIGGFYNVQLNFIVDGAGNPITNYGRIYLIGFHILRFFHLLDVCTVDLIKDMIKEAKFVDTYEEQFSFLLVRFPRPMICDKFFKLLLVLTGL